MRVALGCRDNFPAGQNHLGLDHVAGARPVHAGVVAVPAKQREADVADGGAGPTHDHAAVLRGLVVQLPEVHARAQRHRAADGRVAPVRHKGAVPLGVGQPVRPEEQAAQHGGAAEPVVPGAFDGDGQAVLGGELHRMLGIHRAADAHGFCRGGVGGGPSGPGRGAHGAALLHAPRLVKEPQGVREGRAARIGQVDRRDVLQRDLLTQRLPWGIAEAGVWMRTSTLLGWRGFPGRSPGQDKGQQAHDTHHRSLQNRWAWTESDAADQCSGTFTQ
mmetsp:Transcript_100648/g.284952  ORF Transcript_100648/g.284952 Transcript_100648/m.284952 type:complete len:274 (-) Transcript_100648:4-825(-)